MAKLFFSYSHKDEALRDELEVQLEMLKKQGAIQTWHDRRIRSGDELSKQIDAQLESADIILLLVSPDFLASDYCYNVEFSRAMERHEEGSARVIPVILRPCDWKAAPFAKLLVAPRDGKPVTKWPDHDEAFLDVIQQIRAALPEVPSDPQPLKTAPVGGGVARPGPRSSNLRLKKEFTEADKDRFLDAVFEHMGLFFENSLGELEARNQGIETRFKRIDANTFTAVIYRDGSEVASCQIRNKGRRGPLGGITYSHEETSHGDSCNEALTVDADDHSLFMRATWMSGFWGNSPEHLSAEGAAEHYWGLLIDTLR